MLFLGYASESFKCFDNFVISGIGCGVSMTGLGLYIFATKDFWPEYKFPAFVSYLPVLMLMTFTAASTIGYLVVPWVMIGEVYPTKVIKRPFNPF